MRAGGSIALVSGLTVLAAVTAVYEIKLPEQDEGPAAVQKAFGHCTEVMTLPVGPNRLKDVAQCVQTRLGKSYEVSVFMQGIKATRGKDWSASCIIGLRCTAP